MLIVISKLFQIQNTNCSTFINFTTTNIWIYRMSTPLHILVTRRNIYFYTFKYIENIFFYFIILSKIESISILYNLKV